MANQNPAASDPPLTRRETGRRTQAEIIYPDEGTAPPQLHDNQRAFTANPTIINITNTIETPTPRRHGRSSVLAAILSFLLPGLGQVYNGQVAKGVLMFLAAAILWVFLLGWIVNLWSIFDAYYRAKDA